MDGLLIIDKPSGCTSHDVVAAVRRITGERKAGHGGTLDPDATGVIIVGLGKATRFFQYITGFDKTYTGTIRLGLATDTYDASGRPTTAEASELPSLEAVADAVRGLTGDIMQTPPPYSSKKIAGRAAYKIARSGGEPVLTPVPVTVRRFDIVSFRPPFLDFEIDCSSGTYIRSLAHDLGRTLGCGAHLTGLRRTLVGTFTIGQAVTPEGLTRAAREGALERFLIPLERILSGVPAVYLTGEGEERVRHGAGITPEVVDGTRGDDPFGSGKDIDLLCLFDRSGRLIALGRYSSGKKAVSPFAVLV